MFGGRLAALGQFSDLAGHNGNILILDNEESREHSDIYVCDGTPRNGWRKFWDDMQWYG